MLFVDFHKAFDSIPRGKLMEIPKAYDIPLETVNAISLLYKNTTAKVISPDGDTSFFPIHAGVLQGDTLNTIWNSNLPKNLKLALSLTTVCSVLLYGSST